MIFSFHFCIKERDCLSSRVFQAEFCLLNAPVVIYHVLLSSAFPINEEVGSKTYQNYVCFGGARLFHRRWWLSGGSERLVWYSISVIF